MKVGHNCGFCVAHTLHDTYAFIKSLQHRGREACGIAFIGENRIDVIKWEGSVSRFDIEDLYTLFPSTDYHTYLAHVRYATRGRKDKILLDAHPQVIGGKVRKKGQHVIITDCEAVMVHNGQVGGEQLKEVDQNKLKGDCDTEALLHLYAAKGEKELLKTIKGSYTLAAARKGEEVIVLRDPLGMKPGVLGWKDGKHVIASEDIAFKKNEARYIKDLQPGNAYTMHPNGGYSEHTIGEQKKQHCFFEWNYISSAESILDGISVRRVREELGKELSHTFPLKIDYVSFLPRCPEAAARRYATELNIPFINVFYKTRNERSFLGSTSEERKQSISSNLFLLPNNNGTSIQETLNGKTIAIIDDSTIRGNNSKRAIELLQKETNVKKIYLINYTPKIGIIPKDGEPRGCIYGVDMPPTDKFIARNHTDTEINKEIGAEVLFLPMERMLACFQRLGIPKEKLCHYCIGGNKPF